MAVLLAAGAPLRAQVQEPAPHKQLISANPFLLLVGWGNAEFERIVASSATVGAGGSFYRYHGDNYRNVDVFYRYYAEGTPLQGWGVDAKAGLTTVGSRGPYFGYGFDANYSWLMGAKKEFYVGVGFGLKRLVDVPDGVRHFVPTVRLVNIGLTF